MAAQATIIQASFTGTTSSGTDTTSMFGTFGADLTGDAVSGTIIHDRGLLPVDQRLAKHHHCHWTERAGLNRHDRGFHRRVHRSGLIEHIAIVPVPNAYRNANPVGTTAETFYLDVSDPFTPFINSTDLPQTFATTDPSSSSGTFSISRYRADRRWGFCGGDLPIGVGMLPVTGGRGWRMLVENASERFVRLRDRRDRACGGTGVTARAVARR
jgi:hypothetical protein